MGEIADMMLGGEMCEMCGVYFVGQAEGFPRYCSIECANDRGAGAEQVVDEARSMSYRDAPSDEIFDEIKRKAIEIWHTYDDTYGYATEKIDYINSITNVKDNYGTIIGMFDHTNQIKLLDLLSVEARGKVYNG